MENLTGGTPPVRYLPCVVPCKLYFMPVEIYGFGKLYEFEGRHYRGPADIDEYLKRLFGNYMELPPVEKRTEYMDYISDIVTNREA